VSLAIERGRQRPADVERLLGELPDWFGMPESNANYVTEAAHLPTLTALDGIGRALVDAVEDDLRTRGVRLLHVKTFGPSGHSEPYERTRAFNLAVDFVPLEERTDIWGPDNPCLILVKPLAVP
jgi:hypothetical protein